MKDFNNIINEINSEISHEQELFNQYNKHAGFLRLEDIFTTESIVLSAQYCSKGFMNRRDTRFFMDALWYNSYMLCQDVLNESFKPYYYKEKVIIERGKARVIRPPEFKTKVVQKVLNNYVIRPIFVPKMINTCYASVHGRGTAKMYDNVLSALHSVEKDKDKVIVTTDYSKFFPSIDLSILSDTYKRYIHDERVVSLIESFSDGELSLGNELSQVPASYFPSPVDHCFKDKLGIRHYFRYMDDILFIADNESHARELLDILREESEKINLVLKDEEIHMINMGHPFAYCKGRFLWDRNKQTYYRIQNPDIARNERRKLRKFADKVRAGEMTLDEAEAQYRGVRGMISSHPNTYNRIRKLDDLMNEVRNADIARRRELEALV